MKRRVIDLVKQETNYLISKNVYEGHVKLIDYYEKKDKETEKKIKRIMDRLLDNEGCSFLPYFEKEFPEYFKESD